MLVSTTNAPAQRRISSTAAADQTLNVIQALEFSTKYLAGRGIESPRLNAERLICHTLDLSRVEMYLNFERPLSGKEQTEFRKLLKRRGTHEPLQHILQIVEFMSLPFHVTPAVLIPRPETEILAERCMVAWKGRRMSRAPRILDMGTGSGCIAVSLAANIPGAECTAIDVSDEALAVAEKNAAANGVKERIRFIQADVLQRHTLECIGSTFDIVVSNPPYVSIRDFENLPEEIRLFEPEIALTDGGDGLTYYRAIANLAPHFLEGGGHLMVEIGAGQEEAVKRLFQDSGFTQVAAFADLNDIQRVISAELSNL
jgi:release factor glutamine methyltransferase